MKNLFRYFILTVASALVVLPAHAGILSDIQSGRISPYPYFGAVLAAFVFLLVFTAYRARKQSRKVVNDYEAKLDEFRRSIRMGQNSKKR
ncbi:MAG: hypothetical protein U5K75_03470 [Ahrensia sp.]|nr:hypothetical protein [Ahrensia sp.]